MSWRPSACKYFIILLPHRQSWYRVKAFVRSGWVNIHIGTASDVGQYSYRWSQVSRSNIDAYGLGVDLGDVYPLYNGVRRLAFPLRCLYLGSV